MFPDCMVSSELSYLSARTQTTRLIHSEGNDTQDSEIRGFGLCRTKDFIIIKKRDDLRFIKEKSRQGCRGSTIILNTVIKNRQPATIRKGLKSNEKLINLNTPCLDLRWRGGNVATK